MQIWEVIYILSCYQQHRETLPSWLDENICFVWDLKLLLHMQHLVVIDIMPCWQPKKRKDAAVKVFCYLKISFSLFFFGGVRGGVVSLAAKV